MRAASSDSGSRESAYDMTSSSSRPISGLVNWSKISLVSVARWFARRPAPAWGIITIWSQPTRDATWARSVISAARALSCTNDEFSTALSLSVNCDDCLDLHRDACRQLGHSDRAPGREPAIFTVHVDDQVREAVDDGRLVAEFVGRADEAEHLHPALDAVERAPLVDDPAQREQGRLAGRRVP